MFVRILLENGEIDLERKYIGKNKNDHNDEYNY